MDYLEELKQTLTKAKVLGRGCNLEPGDVREALTRLVGLLGALDSLVSACTTETIIFDDAPALVEARRWLVLAGQKDKVWLVRTADGRPLHHMVPITWRQCDSGCPGWLHMDSPREVQACDDCARFAALELPAEEAAILAHREECGCGYPEEAGEDGPLFEVRGLSGGEDTVLAGAIPSLQVAVDERDARPESRIVCLNDFARLEWHKASGDWPEGRTLTAAERATARRLRAGGTMRPSDLADKYRVPYAHMLAVLAAV